MICPLILSDARLVSGSQRGRANGQQGIFLRLVSLCVFIDRELRLIRDRRVVLACIATTNR